MKKNSIVRRLLLVLSILMILTSSVQGTMAFLVSKTDSIVNIFVPISYGGFVLDKTVEHPYGDDYSIPVTFDFEIGLGEYYAGKTINTNYGGEVANDEGAITVSVKPGVALVISDLTEGTVVTVTEVSNLPGFTIKDGVATKTATVGESGNIQINFVNVYSPEPLKLLDADENATVTLIGKKTLEGREGQEGDSFTFILEQEQGKDNWVKIGEKTVAYDAENKVFPTFDLTEDLVKSIFTSIGTYAFRISEVKGELDRVDYDETVNYFYIKVTDNDMDGKLELKGITASQNAKVELDQTGVYEITVDFNNTYVPLPVPDDIYVNITAKKVLSGAGASNFSPDRFVVMLTDEDGNSRSLNTVGGKAVFELQFTADDIGEEFIYTLAEVDNNISGVTYSDKVYTIKVKIDVNDQNELVATVTSGGNTIIDGHAFEFINICAKPLTPPTSDSGEMILWGIVFVLGVALLAGVIITDRKRPLTR